MDWFLNGTALALNVLMAKYTCRSEAYLEICHTSTAELFMKIAAFNS